MYVFIPFIKLGNKVTCLLDNLIFGVMDILDDEYNYAVLFSVKMGSYCLGLHDKKIFCVVK